VLRFFHCQRANKCQHIGRPVADRSVRIEIYQVFALVATWYVRCASQYGTQFRIGQNSHTATVGGRNGVRGNIVAPV